MGRRLTKRALIEALDNKPAGLTVALLARRLNFSTSTIRKHLRPLWVSGYVEVRERDNNGEWWQLVSQVHRA